IGKNLVAMMIESAGFEVIDLGVDVPVEKFVAAAQEEGVKIVACSALLTTTMPALEATVAALKATGKDYKIMVGGAPITQEFADKVGADAFTADAASAAKKARELVA
ncbi:MAG: cobalamin-dependent protein, partial [Oscillospiraceae bacterium]|nr:cobalamin-dependent protein [Oscillospiraceae bacterium]